MKKLLFIISFVFSTLFSFAQTGIATANLNLRNSPSLNGDVLTTIPNGTSNLKIESEENGWYKILYNEKEGYVSKKYVRNSNTPTSKKNNQEAHPTQKTHYYTNVSGEKVQSPTHYDSPPSGATAECRDGTYSFSKHRRGTCSHHGGVKRWL